MIVWISSYPRSGNTMLRLLLNEVFGVCADTRYKGLPAIEQLFGAEPSTEPWSEVAERLRQDPAIHLVKTHEAPEATDDRCIYIVRHPGSAIVSFRHYLKDIEGLDLPLMAVAMGFCPFGSWSDHVRAWAPLTRPNTLFLRFEDVKSDAAPAIGQIADFLQKDPVGTWNGDIGRLSAVVPSFFRAGSNSQNLDELMPLQRRLIALQHGETAQTLGYDLASEDSLDVAAWEAGVSCLKNEMSMWRTAAEERLHVIQGLERVCQERLELINRLSSKR